MRIAALGGWLGGGGAFCAKAMARAGIRAARRFTAAILSHWRL
jgi:hypothetical protein